MPMSDEATEACSVDASAFFVEACPALYVISPRSCLGLRYPLRQGFNSLGRSKRSSILISQPTISRRHITLTVDKTGAVHLKDVGSKNGTLINGHRVSLGESVQLQDGDELCCGGVLLKYIGEGKVDHALLEELCRQACVDPLTGVANRRSFQNLAEAEFQRAHRYGCALSLIMLDLDRFKQVNDRYGHLCGDEVLAQTASRLQQTLRRQDLMCRWGGEEFAVLLPETGTVGALAVAHALRTAVTERAYRYQGDSLEVTVSLGVATLGKQHRTFVALVASSDEQLLRAKRLGRNRVCVDDRGDTRRTRVVCRPDDRARRGGCSRTGPARR